MSGGHSYDMLKRSKQNAGLRKRDSSFSKDGQYTRLRRYRRFFKVKRLSARQMQLLMEAVYNRQAEQERAFRFTVLITIALVIMVITGAYWWWVSSL